VSRASSPPGPGHVLVAYGPSMCLRIPSRRPASVHLGRCPHQADPAAVSEAGGTGHTVRGVMPSVRDLWRQLAPQTPKRRFRRPHDYRSQEIIYEHIGTHHPPALTARPSFIYASPAPPSVEQPGRVGGLQYGLRERAVELGWRATEIEVIDADQRMSGERPAPRGVQGAARTRHSR